MNKYIIFSVIGLAIILSAGTALAYQGDMSPRANSEDMQAHRNEMQTTPNSCCMPLLTLKIPPLSLLAISCPKI